MMTVLVILFVHIGAAALYNKYRIQQLVQHISRCRGQELTEAEFGVLLRRYTAFLAPYSFSPSLSQYPALYTNEDFAAFARQSKYVMIYLYAVIIPAFMTLMAWS